MNYQSQILLVTFITLIVYLIVMIVLASLGLVTNRFSAAVVWLCLSIPTFATWWKVRYRS